MNIENKSFITGLTIGSVSILAFAALVFLKPKNVDLNALSTIILIIGSIGALYGLFGYEIKKILK